MVVTQATSVDDTLSLVSDSARVIAAWRAIETEEGTPLCVDPFAAQLAGTHALKVARSMAQPFDGRNLPADSPHRQRAFKVSNVAPRVWWFDRQAEAALGGRTGGKPLTQVVVMGSGMDTRPWRCSFIPASARWFELDLPDMAAIKPRAMRALGAQTSGEESGAEHPLRCARWQALAADLSGTSWVPQLEAAGFDRAQPALFILEGLLMYLLPAHAHLLLKTMAEVAAPGSVVVTHNITDRLVRGVADGSIAAYPPFSLDLVKTWYYGFADDTEAEFASLGWRVTECSPRSGLVRQVFGVTSDEELEGCCDFDCAVGGSIDSFSSFVTAVVAK